MKYTILFLALGLIFIICLSGFSEPKIEVLEPLWDLGEIKRGGFIEKIFKVRNSGSDELIIKKVRPSCDCLSLSVLIDRAQKGGFVEIKAVFDSNSVDVKDKFTKYIYIQTNDPNSPVVRITVLGALFAQSGRQQDKHTDKVAVVVFYSVGCKECKKIKDVFLPSLVKKYEGRIEVKNYDINILENYLLLMEYEERYRVKESSPVIVFAGLRFFAGKSNILNKLEPYINDLLVTRETKRVSLTEVDKERLLDKFRTFSPFIIFSAGFIDGLNPCAFVTVVFLISYLFLLKSSRREILFIGTVFSIGVFIAYLLIGFGLREVLYRMEVFNVISDAIYIIAICLILILGCYSLYDAFTYLKRRDIKLKLPELLRIKIHNIIKKSLTAKGLIFTVFLAGFLISLLESICTGQVYLPTVMFIMKEPDMRYSSILYLILYNLAFIIPLVVVIISASFGVGLGRFISFSRKNTFIAKLLLSLLFFILGILLIV